MRWPFGPPHLTLKPSKKKQKQKKNKKKQNKKNNKKKKKEKPRKKKIKNTKNTKKKKLFSYQSKFSFFLTGYPKIAVFWHLGPENAHPKTL